MEPVDTNIIVCHAIRHEYDLYIGRANPFKRLKASIWKNPFPLPTNGTFRDRDRVLAQYQHYVWSNPDLVERLKRGELLGKRLACWCWHHPVGPEPPSAPHCHGDILRILQAQLYEGGVIMPGIPLESADGGPEKPTAPGITLTARQLGERSTFPNQNTITSRVIYREDIGKTTDGLKISAGIAYNPEGEKNIWFVCLIAIGGEIFSRKPHNQLKNAPNAKAIADGWIREVGHQLKIISKSDAFFRHQTRSSFELEEAIKGVWPQGVPTKGEVNIAAEHGNAAKNANRAYKRDSFEETMEAARLASESKAKQEAGEQPLSLQGNLFDD